MAHLNHGISHHEFLDRTLDRVDALGHDNLRKVLHELLDNVALTSNPGHLAGKVEGYIAQPDAKVALVNEFKADEERLLRKIDKLEEENVADYEQRSVDEHGHHRAVRTLYDGGMLYDAQLYLQIGFMLLNRAVFQPQRIKLPEDGE